TPVGTPGIRITTVTRPDGSYAFGSIPNGIYKLFVNPPSGSGGAPPAPVSVTYSGTPVAVQTITLGSLGDTIVVSVVTDAGTPITVANVLAVSTDGLNYVVQRTADSSGKFNGKVGA